MLIATDQPAMKFHQSPNVSLSVSAPIRAKNASTPSPARNTLRTVCLATVIRVDSANAMQSVIGAIGKKNTPTASVINTPGVIVLITVIGSIAPEPAAGGGGAGANHSLLPGAGNPDA